MTMKTKKTLAAVAVVLLALCLVFAAPVSAEGDATIDTGVANIGGDYYLTLQSAVNDATSGTPESPVIITLVNGVNGEITGDGVVVNGQNITIDFNGLTYNVTGALVGSSGTGSNCFQLKSGTVTMKNGKIITSAEAKSTDKYSGSEEFKQAACIIKNYATLTLEDMVIDGTGLSFKGGDNFVIDSANGAFTIKGDTTITARGTSDDYEEDSAIIVSYGPKKGYSSGTQVVIGGNADDKVTINGKIDYELWGDAPTESEVTPSTLTIGAGTTLNGNLVVDSNMATYAPEKVVINGGSFTDPTVLNYLGEDAYVKITLQEDFEITSTIEIDADVLLDLNGYDITGTGFNNKYLFAVNSGTGLSIINSGSEDSKITSDGYCIGVRAGGTFLAGDMSKLDSSESFPETINKITFDVVTMGIAAFGFEDEQTDACTVVYLDNKTVIETDNSGIAIYGPNSDNTKCFGVKVLFDGEIKGTHPTDGSYKGTIGITTNGYIKEGDSTIVLGSQAKITALTGNTNVAKDDDAPAIMANGYATWIIAGSTLEGDEAVSMKAGKLAILDGAFKATGAHDDPSDANDNGSEMTGAVISVTNTYAEGSGESGVDIMIMGGTFESTSGHAIFAGQSDTHTETSSVLNSLLILKLDDLSEDSRADITGPVEELGITIGEDVELSFKSASEKDAIKLNNLKDGAIVSISSGLFSTDVNADYLASDYHTKQVEGGYEVTNEWTVTFKSNGGSDVEAIEVVNGTNVNKPTNPTKTNYDFGGWFTDSGFTSEYDFTAPVTADIALYAKWTAATSSPGNNNGGSGSGSSSSSKPTTPVEPETPTEEPVAGEPTVETEVTDGGEVVLETPTEGGAVAADDDAKITGVVLPTGTDSEVTFIPISEQPAPAGKETSTKKVFEINVPTYEKGKPATIKFTMTVAELEADGKTAGEVALWHFDEETGEWTKLLTSYTIVDGIVYFEAITYDFSPFAIIYEETPVEEPVEEPETPATPAPILAVLAGLGAAVVLRRK